MVCARITHFRAKYFIEILGWHEVKIIIPPCLGQFINAWTNFTWPEFEQTKVYPKTHKLRQSIVNCELYFFFFKKQDLLNKKCHILTDMPTILFKYILSPLNHKRISPNFLTFPKNVLGTPVIVFLKKGLVLIGLIIYWNIFKIFKLCTSPIILNQKKCEIATNFDSRLK